MLTNGERILLTVGAQHQMRLDPQRTHREAAVARVAESFLVVAAVALLRIVLGFKRVETDEVAAMAFGLVVTAKVTDPLIVPGASALMAIKTP